MHPTNMNLLLDFTHFDLSQTFVQLLETTKERKNAHGLHDVTFFPPCIESWLGP
jgi:hypothetical protein